MPTKKNKKIYTLNDYKNGDGMLTAVWGPSLWHYLHIMSFNYPVEPTNQDKINYRQFILNLQNVLPCKYCRINLKNNFKAHPLKMCHMKNRDSFSRYIFKLHEIINKMLNKNSNLKYCDVRERYEHFRSRCTQKQIKEKIFKYKDSSNKTKKEKGCIEPLYGIKSKCVLKIIPDKSKTKTFTMNKTCKKRRLN